MTREEANSRFDNFVELYDVRPGETDFIGAIDRSLEQGIKHLSENFLIKVSELLTERRNGRKQNYGQEKEPGQL